VDGAGLFFKQRTIITNYECGISVSAVRVSSATGPSSRSPAIPVRHIEGRLKPRFRISFATTCVSFTATRGGLAPRLPYSELNYLIGVSFDRSRWLARARDQITSNLG
jgi:hypothetical protein